MKAEIIPENISKSVAAPNNLNSLPVWMLKVFMCKQYLNIKEITYPSQGISRESKVY
jgi:hypothetical protein